MIAPFIGIKLIDMLLVALRLVLAKQETFLIGRQIRSAVILLVLLTVLTGIIYPLVVTGILQAAFHHQANGSLIEKDSSTSVPNL